MCFKLVFVTLFTFMAFCHGIVFECPDSIQRYNNEELLRCLQDGWPRFCNADVDQTVIGFYPGAALRDVKLLLFGKEAVHTYYFADLCELCVNPDFQKGRKTIVFITGFPPNEKYSAISELWRLRQQYHDCNIIAVDLATSVEQCHCSLHDNFDYVAHAVSKLLHYLVEQSYVLVQDVHLIGFSVGAQVAAHATVLLREDFDIVLHHFLLLDPAATCDGSNWISRDCAKKVVALHTNSGHYGISDIDVHVQLFPNGKIRLQPCCGSNVCSHYFAITLLVDALCAPNSVLFVQCNEWNLFGKGKCDYKNVIALDLEYPSTAEGTYYCLTSEHEPYGLGNAGIKPGGNAHH